MLDETSFPKAGSASVGVARQYCGALGKVANCRVAVSLHWSTAQMSCPLLWRLYLPRQWLDDPARRAGGRIPADVQYRSKNELALDLVPVPAGKPRGRPRLYAPLAAMPTPQTLGELAGTLPASAWRTVTWRAGSKGPQRSRFAQVKVWAAHGWKVQRHPERVAEWPEGAATPSDYWLADLGPQPVGLRRLVRTARARWRVELDYRELKEELGLDHYEGRHWLGWHHHVTLVSVAFAFLRTEQACRSLQAALIRLAGRCPWCQTRFIDTC